MEGDFDMLRRSLIIVSLALAAVPVQSAEYKTNGTWKQFSDKQGNITTR